MGGKGPARKTRGKQASKERWRDEMGCREGSARKTREKQASRDGEMRWGAERSLQ